MANFKQRHGYSLVELLVATALMGLVVMAIYGLYTSTQRQAYTTEEVVEVQQNLRIALDRLSRDIRLAGFLIPLSQDKFGSVPQMSLDTDDDGDCAEHNPESIGCFSFRTVSVTGAVGRLDADTTIATGGLLTDKHAFTLGHPEMVDLFEGPGNDVADRWARIVRPGTGTTPLAGFFKVHSDSDRGSSSLVMTGVSAPETILYYPGDIVLPYTDEDADSDNDITTGSAPSLLNLVRYRLVDDPDSDDPAMHVLRRDINGDTAGAIDLAAKVTDLTLSYILDDGSEVNWVKDPTLYEDIVAVRIRISGATDATRTGSSNFSGVKRRTLETLVKLRN